jgi:hypothetical protein
MPQMAYPPRQESRALLLFLIVMALIVVALLLYAMAGKNTESPTVHQPSIGRFHWDIPPALPNRPLPGTPKPPS